MKYRSLSVVLLFLMVVAGGWRFHAAEIFPDAVWVPSRHGMPEKLATVSSHNITYSMLAERINRIALENPYILGLGEDFLRCAVIQTEAMRNNIIQPSEKEIDLQMEKKVLQAGGDRALAGKFKRAGLALVDLRRAVKQELLLRNITSSLSGVPTSSKLSPDWNMKTLKDLRKKYDPVFRGMADPRPATVGGRNYTAGEIVDFVIGNCRSPLLKKIIDSIIEEQLVVQEAARNNLSPELSPQEAFETLLEVQLTPEKLKEYFERIKPELEIIHAAMIFCAFDRRPGKAYTPQKPITVEARATAKLRAQTIFDLVKRGEMDFATAARNHSDCPSASLGGDRGYWASSGKIAANVNPSAYSLDYLVEGGRRRSPIGVPPSIKLFNEIKKLKDGEMSASIEIPIGYVILKRIDSRMPGGADAMMDYLRGRRLAEGGQKLLEELREKAEIKILWDPESRD